MKRLVSGMVVTFVMLLSAASAFAEPSWQAEGIAMQITGGYDGYYEDGQWIPLRVVVSNDGPDVMGSLQAVDERFGGGDVIYSRPIDLPGGSRKEVFLYFSPDSFVSNLEIELVAADSHRRLATSSAPLRQVNRGDILYGVLSDNPSAFSQLSMVEPVGGNAQVAILSIDDLPPLAEAWRALDVVIFSDVDSAQLGLDQQAALRAWVASGGRLIVTGGIGWQRTAAGLDALLPVEVTGSTTVQDISSLADLLKQSSVSFAGETPVSVAQPRQGGTVEVWQGDIPIWAWRDLGQGRIDYLAVDPAFEPLRSIPDIDMLWRTILSRQSALPVWGDGFHTSWHYARDAVASIPGVSLPSVFQLCGFLTIYAIIIGPGNYIILKRMRRTELAWFTIPALVVVFSGIAYMAGFQLRGTQAVVHRVAVVQSWPDSDIAQVDGLVGVWSPRRTRYDVQIDGQYLTHPLQESVGGLTTSSISNRLIEQGRGSLLRDMRVDVGAVQAFVVQGHAEARHVESELVLAFSEGGIMRATGVLNNTSGLDLEDVVLLAGGTAQSLGDLPDGETIRLDASLLGGQAIPVGTNGLGLAQAGNVAANPGYSNVPDTTIEDIVGVSYCFGDPEIERRCNLLSATIEQFGIEYRGSRPGVYLVGWADTSPLDVSVIDAGSEQVNTAVYFFALPFELGQTSQTAIVPPSLMTWQVLDADVSGGMSPYDTYMASGGQVGASFRYQPLPYAALDTVTGLTIHLEASNSASVQPPIVELWDWQANEWEIINVDWDDTPIASPETYVDAEGGVHLRISLANQVSPISLNRVDLTLKGVPSS